MGGRADRALGRPKVVPGHEQIKVKLGGQAHELAAAGSEGRLVLEMESLAQMPAVLESLRTAGVTVLDFSVHSPNLADAFLRLTGRSLHERTAA